MGSSYATRVLSSRLQIAHSNVCKSTPARTGSILASIIGALHFGQAGRSIATNGMTDDRRLDCGMMLPSNGGRATLSVTGIAWRAARGIYPYATPGHLNPHHF